MSVEKNSQNHDEMIPLEFHLSQNYPNPFRDKTIIKYCIAYKTKATISIYNADKMMIKKILHKEHEAGTYEIEFDGSSLPEGIYFCELIADGFSERKKIVKKYSH